MFLYLRGLEYCAAHETDGLIPREVVPSLVADFSTIGLWITQPKRAQVSAKCPPSVPGVTGQSRVTQRDMVDDASNDDDTGELSKQAHDRRRRRLVQRLVDAGLWHETPHGYEVNDYLQYQPERTEIAERDERRKAKARERKRRQRANQSVREVSAKCPNVTHVTPYTKRGYSLRSNPQVGRDANSGGTPALEGAGAPVAPMDETPTADVGAVIDEHGPQAIIKRLADAKRMT
jgi:hypothetical protein